MMCKIFFVNGMLFYQINIFIKQMINNVNKKIIEFNIVYIFLC